MASTIPAIFFYTPAASETIVCPSGNSYTSDSNHLIYNPQIIDFSFLSQVGCILLNQRNQVATFAPGGGNDYTQLFGAGSLWYDTSNSTLYLCNNPGPPAGTANWVATSFSTSPNLTTNQIVNGSASATTANIFVSNTSGLAPTITLNVPSYFAGFPVKIFDTFGNFSTLPCTVATSSGVIRSNPTFILVTSYGKDEFVFDGTNWW